MKYHNRQPRFPQSKSTSSKFSLQHTFTQKPRGNTKTARNPLSTASPEAPVARWFTGVTRLFIVTGHSLTCYCRCRWLAGLHVASLRSTVVHGSAGGHIDFIAPVQPTPGRESGSHEPPPELFTKALFIWQELKQLPTEL